MVPEDEHPASKQPEDTSGPNEVVEPEDSAPEEDFAAMLEESLQPRTFQAGQAVEGVLVAVGKDVAFVDIGGKGEAVIDLEELQDEDGQLEVTVGDTLKAQVVSTSGGIKLSRKLARGAASRQQLSLAFNARLPVEGTVEKVNKGGYEVKVAGQRAFCPLSQIDTVRTEDPEEHVGKAYTFRIIELKDGGKNLVVSRRAILEEEERKKAKEVMATVVPGAVLTGKVVSLQSYGAFMDLGAGVQGLLHVSEMGWSRVASAAEVVAPGQELAVQVLKVDPATKKISLSLKQLQADPWLAAAKTFAAGQTCEGKVTRLAEFGAFVELAPGVEALAHSSTFPPSKGGWQAMVPSGTTARFRIESVEVERRRIGVSLAVGAMNENEPDAVTASSGQPQGEGFGSLADKLRAAMQDPGKKD
ncbi:MAG: S1 RNA-binding domain-containing protein [Acidobacteria bacterium]|nr:S1 RNA-binding domain-containing protein [Acidobacteriota bacterium]